MRHRPFSELSDPILRDPERRARIEVMNRALDDSYDLTQSLRDEGFTEQQIIDRLQEVEIEITGESELYRTTFRDYIDAMRRDLEEAAVREESPVYLDTTKA